MLLSGCACHPVHDDSGLFWRSYHSFDSDFATSTAEEEQFIRVWNEQASSDALDRPSRREIIFLLFRRFVRPGFTSANCRKVLRNSTWLDEVRIEPVGGLGGRIPVDLPLKGATTFSMAVLPEPGQSTEHYIWFTLLGVELGEGCRQKALDFWKGNLMGGAVRLHEFALCYPPAPRDKTERFTRDGIGLEVP